MTIDDIIEKIRPQLRVEADAEHEILEEIRAHLEEAAEAGRSRGMSEDQAVREAAAAFGIEASAAELRKTHAGWGTLEGVAAAALPVVLTLVLRWLVFAPDGTVTAWREMLSPAALVIIAAVMILVPLLRFPKRRYAIALWLLFWALSLLTVIWPASRW